MPGTGASRAVVAVYDAEGAFIGEVEEEVASSGGFVGCDILSAIDGSQCQWPSSGMTAARKSLRQLSWKSSAK
jgi:hypothetical protein